MEIDSNRENGFDVFLSYLIQLYESNCANSLSSYGFINGLLVQILLPLV